MTEHEKKAIKWMQNVRDDAVVTLDHIAKEEPNVSPMLYTGRKEKAEAIIKGFEELEQYREIGTVEECRAAVEIIRYMIQEGIEPEVLKAYVRFEDELVKNGFTVKSVLEAREKQKPKKPKEYEDKYYGCPTCGNVILHKWEKYPTKLMDKKNGLPYCLNCGQKLDWSDGE